jgi:hypothetical protein
MQLSLAFVATGGFLLAVTAEKTGIGRPEEK